jgi:NitT/TauT family transport system substrate-binding protein
MREEASMSASHAARWSRREFLGSLTLVGTAGLLGLRSGAVIAEPPPETTRLRLYQVPGICTAPQYVAEDLLHLEGFTEVQYVPVGHSTAMYEAFGSGAVDLGMAFVPPFIRQVDAAVPLVLLGGEHVGCYELFGTHEVRVIRLHELGLIQSTPQKITAQGTDWRFFNELKQELKG